MQRFPGGKGANQAIAAGRLGASVSMLAQLGADAFGNALLKVLGAEGISVDSVGQIHGLSSGVALISVAANGENAIVVAPGATMVWSQEAVAMLNRVVAGARVLVVNLEVPPSVVATAVRAARAPGGTVILNPAPHRTGDEECFRDVDSFVPNQIEAALFAGMEPESVDDWQAIGWRLRELGPWCHRSLRGGFPEDSSIRPISPGRNRWVVKGQNPPLPPRRARSRVCGIPVCWPGRMGPWRRKPAPGASARRRSDSHKSV